MRDAAEALFEDERIAADDAAVDAVIAAAGGTREAIRALLVQLGEARAAADRTSSLGFRRGRQPVRRLP